MRGEPLVAKVLEATLGELAASGYAALSIEEIAARAGVARTTIYRRWPSKADLVLAAMGRVADEYLPSGESGDVRTDLLTTLRGFRDFASTTRGECLMRMVLAEGVCSEVAQLASKIRRAKEAGPRRLIERAIERGELRAGTEPDLLVDMLFAAVQYSRIVLNEPCDDERLARVLDLVLAGATNARPGGSGRATTGRCGVGERPARRR